MFFALAGLDALGKLDAVVSSEAKSAYIDWIYAQQVLPDATEPEINAEKLGGRRREVNAIGIPIITEEM